MKPKAKTSGKAKRAKKVQASRAQRREGDSELAACLRLKDEMLEARAAQAVKDAGLVKDRRLMDGFMELRRLLQRLEARPDDREAGARFREVLARVAESPELTIALVDTL